MKIKKSFFLLIILCKMNAQNEPLEADRPDQTETPSIVPVGMFQVESGFSFEKSEAQSFSFLLPSSLCKYGVSKKKELRMITEFLFEEQEREKQNGMLPVAVGFKINLLQERKWVPKTSLISHISLKNCASEKYKSTYSMPDFRFTLQHALTKNYSLGSNLGATWDNFTKQPTFLYTFTLGHSISKYIGSYVEVFGFAPQNQIAFHTIDGGITYYINNNLMLDGSIGLGITQNAPKYYLALGITFRI
jgi:hypothetical protein